MSSSEIERLHDEIKKLKEANEALQAQLQLNSDHQSKDSIAKYTARLKFLANVSEILSESLDTNTILRSVALMTNEYYSDIFIIDLFTQKDVIVERTLIASRSLDGENTAQFLSNKWVLDVSADNGLSFVIRTGQAKLYPQLTPEVVKSLKLESNYIHPNEKFKSAIIVPLKYYGRVFGTLSFLSLASERIYDESDLEMALELAKRTSFALENARLFTKANEASRAKSIFLTNISHEIRTPLAAILGFAELIANDTAISKKNAQHLATIRKNGDQLLRIVNQVLDLSKLETSIVDLIKTEFSLPQLIDNVCLLMSLKAQEKNLDFEVTSHLAADENIITDSYQLRQILVNVISNAIKFTSKGYIHVDVSTVEYQPQRFRLEIVVSDSGIGMKPDQVKNLFLPFTQADSSMTRKFGGAGLGLFLARKMAHALGGTLELVESHEGKGSKFLISIAIEYHKLPENKITTTQSYVNSKNQTDFIPSINEVIQPQTGKILIVDDSEDNREYFELILESMSVHTDTAVNGREAVSKALIGLPNIIFMDIQMPEMDGLEATQVLRQNNSHAVIVAVTAHAMMGDREKFLSYGFDDYLSKPVNQKTIAKIVTKYLQKQNGQALHRHHIPEI